MPRRAKGPRLHLRPARPGRNATWVILDRGRERGTGCGPEDIEGSERSLADYIASKYEPPKTGGKLARTLIADVVNLYLTEQAPNTSDGGAWIGYMATPILDWWGLKALSEVNKTTCQDYARWRTGQGVSDQTARHELKTLRAAIRHYHSSEHGPLDAVPVVTLPARAEPRIDYWLSRKQVADRIRASRKLRHARHVARLLLIGVYTGTRPGAALALRWMPSTTGGWFDLESETLHRRAQGRKKTRKLAPPARIHARLLPHLRRWKRLDEADGITTVVHYYGKEVRRVATAWTAIAKKAGHIGKDGPHICRHTAATWQMQAGTEIAEAAGYLGMSPKTLWEVYGHHSPAFQSNAARAGGKRLSPMVSPTKSMNAKRTD